MPLSCCDKANSFMLEAWFHWGYRCIYAFIDKCTILRLAPMKWTFHGKAVAPLVAVRCDPIAPKLILANADGCDGIAPYELRGLARRFGMGRGPRFGRRKDRRTQKLVDRIG